MVFWKFQLEMYWGLWMVNIIEYVMAKIITGNIVQKFVWIEEGKGEEDGKLHSSEYQTIIAHGTIVYWWEQTLILDIMLKNSFSISFMIVCFRFGIFQWLFYSFDCEQEREVE